MEIFDLSGPTARRYCRGENLPGQPGEPRYPWKSTRPPVDDTLGPRHRRILVDGINPEFIRTSYQRQRLAEVLAASPEGWSEKYCDAP